MVSLGLPDCVNFGRSCSSRDKRLTLFIYSATFLNQLVVSKVNGSSWMSVL